MATVSEIARLLGIEPVKVKRWSGQFAEYLSLTARPVKGRERRFTEDDLRVLAVVAEHLELSNDFTTPSTAGVSTTSRSSNSPG